MANLYNTAATKLDQFMEGALDGKVKSEIRTRAAIGGVCMAVPLFGVETLAYIFVLWNTYSIISDISGVPFKENIGKNIVSGMVINVIVTAILGALLDCIPVAGWIASFALGYLSLLMSGMGYVKALKVAHGGKSKLNINVNKGIANLQKKKPIVINTEAKNRAIKITKQANSFLVAAEQKDTEGMYDAYQQSKEVFNGTTNQVEDIESVEVESKEEFPTDNSKSKVEKLRELKSLFDEGILTAEEFNIEKKKILSQN